MNYGPRSPFDVRQVVPLRRLAVGDRVSSPVPSEDLYGTVTSVGETVTVAWDDGLTTEWQVERGDYKSRAMRVPAGQRGNRPQEGAYA